MGTLSLGVLDVAYTQTEANGLSQRTTTGKVAQILEDGYHVFGIFYALREEKIAGFLASSIARAFEDKMQGRTVGRSPMFDAEQKIEQEFRSFIYANEMNKLSVAMGAGPVSMAAERGVSHRRMRPNAKRNARPAFVDTGLYVKSFRAVFKP